MKRKLVLGYILELECSERFTKHKERHTLSCVLSVKAYKNSATLKFVILIA